MKHLIPIMVILLMVSTSFVGLANQSETGSIITVDDEGDGDYTTIKEALNNANPGDTIEVYSGTYYEHNYDFYLDNITLQGIPHELDNGSDTGKPFIDGEGNDVVFRIWAKNVIIDGVHIENEAGVAGHTIVLTSNSSECIISNNELANSVMSIIWIRGSNNKIINNNISHSGSNGIGLRYPSNNCLISGNNISNCEDGILLWTSTHHTIIGNRITNCSRYGVDFALGEHSVLEGNHIEDNDIGIQIVGPYISVKNNNFLDNRINILYFTYAGYIMKMLRSVKFNGNYYDNYIGMGPKLIWGALWLIPITMPLNIDWHPAKEPYDIGV